MREILPLVLLDEASRASHDPHDPPPGNQTLKASEAASERPAAGQVGSARGVAEVSGTEAAAVSAGW